MKSSGVMWLWIACCVPCASTLADAELSDVDAEQLYESAAPPGTVPELLESFRTIATKGLYRRDDFYKAATLKRLFGAQPQAEVVDDGVVTVVRVHGWTDLVIGPSAYTDSLPYMKGVWLEARKPDSNVDAVWRRFELSFWGRFDGLDFNSVTALLGTGWTRDTGTERQPQPHRVPSPVTGYMGDSIIVYPAGETRLVLEFDSTGQLHRILAGY
jgi:hypothetical protein